MIKAYLRKKRHIRELQKYLDMLMIDNINLSIQASRFGWTPELQHQLKPKRNENTNARVIGMG